MRLRLFSAVATRAGGEACVCDVSDGLDVGQPTISHHLKVLRDAGLLTSQRRASWVYYSVVHEALIARGLALVEALHGRIVEGAGGMPFAAMLRDPARWAGRTVAAVVSGGNIAPDRFWAVVGARP